VGPRAAAAAAAALPGTTPEALERARSFAYGGSVIQDLGYYPFGNKFFSNLLHYARTGDFVTALLRNAQTVDEFAFALGALAHYANDIDGHPRAVNLSVPITFPKLRAKFGDAVTYVQAPKQHVIVEFSFDVAQAARGRYDFTQYRSLLDFQVSTPRSSSARSATPTDSRCRTCSPTKSGPSPPTAIRSAS
jgi:hypothetical protein